MDVSAVQTVDKPTRDVLVVYDSDGDRQFVGFGGPNDSFADCFISAEQLPLDTLRSSAALVTGTLGLAFPSTAAAMHKAVETARTGSAVVSVTLLIPSACASPNHSLAAHISFLGNGNSRWFGGSFPLGKEDPA